MNNMSWIDLCGVRGRVELRKTLRMREWVRVRERERERGREPPDPWDDFAR